MAQAVHPETLIIGTEALSLHIRFEHRETELGEGTAQLFVDGECVWFQQASDDAPTPVHWTWVDLLAFLGRNWAHLRYEETYPLGLTPFDPRGLRAEAERLWTRREDQSQIDDEDEAVFRFERRHDLATGLKGIFLPSVTLVREGHVVWVATAEAARRVPAGEVFATLDAIGEAIADNIAHSTTPRAQQALQHWQQRKVAAWNQIVRLRSGLPADEAVALVAGQNPADFWELTPANDDSELLAAARLSAGSVDLNARRKVVAAVRAQPRVETPALDQLSEACIDVLNDVEDRLPFEQGYAVAAWLRAQHPTSGWFDPERFLTQRGVRIDEIRLLQCPLAAVACWGPAHGPAVILNTAEKAIPATRHGRRTTLAHELGHLLMDRHRSLPLVEVFGGLTPAWIEQRTRAFAAELLLPRHEAVQALDVFGGTSIASLNACIADLSRNFQVSRTLVAHVLWNAQIRHRLALPVARRLAMLQKERRDF